MTGFSGDSLVKNLPANTGDMGSIPGPGRSHVPHSNYTHASQLLALCSRTQEPQLLKPVRPRAQALQQEKPVQ